jgi:uncharacterized flavoprotein (TIGR03862 family)
MNVTNPGSSAVVVIGAGPAGLMAAEVLAQGGHRVAVFDAMPSVGRKFLLAGKGGLNLTHSEPFESFLSRFNPGSTTAVPGALESALRAFDGHAVRAWAESLGVATFVGTSGRVFPVDMKAAPLLRAWLHRLRAAGVVFHMRHRWSGWLRPISGDVSDASAGWQIGFDAPAGPVQYTASAVVLALGGGSWARLGSDGAWLPWLQAQGVAVQALQPSNCGFDVAGGWSPYFAQRFAGQPFKSVLLRLGDFERRGEFVATATGVEGSLIYAVSARLRQAIEAQGQAVFELDLLPDHSVERVQKEVQYPRGARSLASHLKSRLGLEGLKLAVVFEHLGRDGMNDSLRLAQTLKALPITVTAARPVDEAISTAGGVDFAALQGPSDPGLMLKAMPGVFCAGEMLDWEAPTGGYLLTACLATGRAAGQGVLHYLQS